MLPRKGLPVMEDQTQLLGEQTQLLSEQTQLLPGRTQLLQSTQLVGEPTQLVNAPDWQGEGDTQPVDEDVVYSTAEGNTQPVEEAGAESDEEIARPALSKDGLTDAKRERTATQPRGESVQEGASQGKRAEHRGGKANIAEPEPKTSTQENRREGQKGSTLQLEKSATPAETSTPQAEAASRAPPAEVVGAWRSTRKSREEGSDAGIPTVSEGLNPEQLKSSQTVSQPVDSDAPTESESDGEKEVAGVQKTPGAEQRKPEAERVPSPEIPLSALNAAPENLTVDELRSGDVSKDRAAVLHDSMKDVIPDSDTEGPDGRELEFATAPSVNAPSQRGLLDSSQGLWRAAGGGIAGRGAGTEHTNLVTVHEGPPEEDQERERSQDGGGGEQHVGTSGKRPSPEIMGLGDEPSEQRGGHEGAGKAAEPIAGTGEAGVSLEIQEEPLRHAVGKGGGAATQRGLQIGSNQDEGVSVQMKQTGLPVGGSKGRGGWKGRGKDRSQEQGEVPAGGRATGKALPRDSEIEGMEHAGTVQAAAEEPQHMEEEPVRAPETDDQPLRAAAEQVGPSAQPLSAAAERVSQDNQLVSKAEKRVSSDNAPVSPAGERVSPDNQLISTADEAMPELRPDQREPPFTQIDEDEVPVATYARRSSVTPSARRTLSTFSAEPGDETQAEALGVVDAMLGLNEVDMSQDQEKGLEPKVLPGRPKSAGLAGLTAPPAAQRTFSVFEFENSQLDAEPEELVFTSKKAPTATPVAKKPKAGAVPGGRSMGPPKSVPRKEAEKGVTAEEEAKGPDAGGWINKKGVVSKTKGAVGEKKGASKAAEKVSEKKVGVLGGKKGESNAAAKVPEEPSERGRGPLRSVGGRRGEAPGKGTVRGEAAPPREKDNGPEQPGDVDPILERGKETDKEKAPVGGGLTQVNWTQAFAADSEPPDEALGLDEGAKSPEKGGVSEAKVVKRGLFAASLMSDEEKAAEEREARENEQAAEAEKAAEKKRKAPGRGRAVGRGKATKGKKEDVAPKGAEVEASRRSTRTGGKGRGTEKATAAEDEEKEERVSESEDEAKPETRSTRGGGRGKGKEAVKEAIVGEADQEAEEPSDENVDLATEPTNVLETKAGEKREKATRAEEKADGGGDGKKTVQAVSSAPMGSNRRYKQTAKRRMSNEVTPGERAALKEQLERGLEDTEEPAENEDSEGEEDEEEELEEGGEAGGASMLYMDSQVPIYKYKKLKGAKKNAPKVKPATPGLETKTAAEKNGALPKSGIDKKATQEKKQSGAKRPAEPAGESVGKATKRKKVEPPAERQKALKEKAVGSEKPSTRARGAKSGPSSAGVAGAAKRGQKRELEADTATGGGVAKKAKGAMGRPISSRFRTAPSQGAGSGVKDTLEKKKDQGGVQAAGQAAPQEGVGGRRRSSMLPLASLIKTRGRREQEKGESMDVSFSQVPIASLRGKKNAGTAAKPAAGKKAGQKKGDIDAGEEKGDGNGKMEPAVEAKGRKRKAESLAGDKGGDVDVEIEEEETAKVGGLTEGKGTTKEGAEIGDGAAEAEVVLEEADRSVPLEGGKGMMEQEGGKETERGKQVGRKTRGKETGEEVVLVDEGPSRKTTGRRGRPPKGGATNKDTGKRLEENPKFPAATKSAKKATSERENELGGKDSLDEKPEEEKVAVSTRGKGKRSMSKQAGAAQQARLGKKEKGPEQEKEQANEGGDAEGSGNAEEQRPSKRTRRGGLETAEEKVEALQPEAPSKAAPRKGGRKAALPKTRNIAAPEKAEEAATEKEAEEEELPNEEPAPEIVEEKSGPLRRGGRRSGEDGGGRGLSRKLSVRVSGGVSDDMEGLGSPTLRKRREMGEVKVLFSNRVVDQVKEAQKKILKRLGAQEAKDVPSCTHLVADSFGRTKNMLEAIVGAKKIVTPSWLESCGQAHYFEDEAPHMLKDEKKEKELNFSLKASLAAAEEKRIFEGVKVYITPNTTPDRTFFRSILEMGGGELLTRFGSGGAGSCLVVSSEKDQKVWEPLAAKGIPICTTELLMHAVVQQQLDTTKNLLSEGNVKQPKAEAKTKEAGKAKPQRKSKAWR